MSRLSGFRFAATREWGVQRPTEFPESRNGEAPRDRAGVTVGGFGKVLGSDASGITRIADASIPALLVLPVDRSCGSCRVIRLQGSRSAYAFE
jgi:hypothetical protein